MIIPILFSLMLQGQISQTNEPGIIGTRLNAFTHSIIYIHPGSPAEKAGLLKGDQILAVDGPKYKEIVGHPDTEVILTIKRGKEVFDVRLIRVTVSSLKDKQLDQYFHINHE